MSLRLTLTRSCNHCDQRTEVFDKSLTYNFVPMWASIYPHHSHMMPFEGLLGSQARVFIQGAIEAMEKDPHRFEALNAPNGFGRSDYLLKFLKEMDNACKNFPNAIWSAGR